MKNNLPLLAGLRGKKIDTLLIASIIAKSVCDVYAQNTGKNIKLPSVILREKSCIIKTNQHTLNSELKIFEKEIKKVSQEKLSYIGYTFKESIQLIFR